MFFSLFFGQFKCLDKHQVDSWLNYISSLMLTVVASPEATVVKLNDLFKLGLVINVVVFLLLKTLPYHLGII